MTTGISWTDDTWNPTVGCSRVSPGCMNCYAEHAAAMVNRRQGVKSVYSDLLRIVDGDPRWNGNVRLVADRLDTPLRWRKPRRVFVNSMSDLFHEKLTNEEIAAVFGVLAACPQHTFQVLTKRAKRMREWFQWVEKRGEDGLTMFPDDSREWRINHMLFVTARRAGADLRNGGGEWPLPNVWLGVSVENQEMADERIPDLLATPAALRFLSCEPLLGPLNLDRWLHRCSSCVCSTCPPGFDDDTQMGQRRISWLIAGCESGPGARPCSVDWLRSLRDQCAKAGVPHFLKQAAPRAPVKGVCMGEDPVASGAGSKLKPGGVIELPYLDGVQHKEMPRGS